MSASRAKGTRWETEVVELLRASGFPHAERRALAGNLDKGDVTGIPGVVLECKSTKQLELSAFMAEALVERHNAAADVGAVVWKRRRTPVGEAAVILPLDEFVWLLRAAGYSRQQHGPNAITGNKIVSGRPEQRSPGLGSHARSDTPDQPGETLS